MTVYHIDSQNEIKLVLFKDVTNAADIRKNLIEGQFQCSLINPELILDVFQVLVAVHKAIQNCKTKKMITKSIYTELLYNLSNKRSVSAGQIIGSLQKFGLSDNNTSVLAVFINDYSSAHINEVKSQISGRQVPLNELIDVCDITSVQKEYSVSNVELEVGSLLDAVIGRIATKDFCPQ